ncbi:MAG: 2-phospho-L-lactate guanylyltransferase [Syntrophorhabdaceae bacterium PtaU1.Bin034]|nr:MAG: 2-phospho-L-lactate guanylyltransferase [Syntrophorhabdaceae bacterium PtaU1.Bin034]
MDARPAPAALARGKRHNVGADYGENRLIVFVRSPVKGEVKTRLAKTIGDEATLALYRCFVSDTLATIRLAGYPAVAFFYPPEAFEAVRDWLGNDITCVPQEGGDLGERMLAAFRKAFVGCSRAVLVGSDCPDLPPGLLHEAFNGLKTHDAVIGPAGDGGYYLIGFNSAGFLEAPFGGIEWGGPKVFEDTVAILRENGVDVRMLPPWNDIDEYDDLRALYDRQNSLPPGRLSTMDFLRNRLHW